MPPVTVALAQAAPRWHDAAANRQLFDTALEEVDERVDLVVLPEMFSTGFTMCSAAVAETMNGETVAWLREQAMRRGVVIAASLAITDGARCFNRLVWMPPDAPETLYDKRHLFRMAGEHQHYAAGGRQVVARLGPWRGASVGVLRLALSRLAALPRRLRPAAVRSQLARRSPSRMECPAAGSGPLKTNAAWWA